MSAVNTPIAFCPEVPLDAPEPRKLFNSSGVPISLTVAPGIFHFACTAPASEGSTVSSTEPMLTSEAICESTFASEAPPSSDGSTVGEALPAKAMPRMTAAIKARAITAAAVFL